MVGLKLSWRQLASELEHLRIYATSVKYICFFFFFLVVIFCKVWFKLVCLSLSVCSFCGEVDRLFKTPTQSVFITRSRKHKTSQCKHAMLFSKGEITLVYFSFLFFKTTLSISDGLGILFRYSTHYNAHTETTGAQTDLGGRDRRGLLSASWQITL